MAAVCSQKAEVVVSHACIEVEKLQYINVKTAAFRIRVRVRIKLTG